MRSLAAGGVAAALAVAAFAPAGAQQNTTFKSAVNLLAVDAVVVDRLGEPILGLTPADFVVKINSQARTIVSADLVRYSTSGTTSPVLATAGEAPATTPLIRTPGRVAENTRTVVLAIDEPSFLVNEIKPAARAAQAFVRKLDPNDMVGVYVYPYANPALDMTHDHERVIGSLDKIIGRRDREPGSFDLSPYEIIEVSAGNRELLAEIAGKECPRYLVPCADQIAAEARWLGSQFEYEGARRVVAISQLIYSLGALPGHKTLVVLSAGLILSDRVGGRPDFRSYMSSLGEEAARANVMLYLIHMDNAFDESMSVAGRPNMRPEQHAKNAMADAGALAGGLERMAGEAGGVYLPWKAGTGELVFNRVLRETAAYYLLGVEPGPKDWDGRTLLVSVSTKIKGATVRTLRQVIAR